MKVVKFFSVALISSFLTVSGVLASDISSPKVKEQSAENSIREEIANALKNISVKDNTVAYLQFNVDDKGFKVLGVQSLDSDVANKVKSIIADRSFDTSNLSSGTYLIKLSFVY
jgi:hypothetical protein